MRFLYLGQTSMGNRGCEALVRSNTALIREQFPDATFLCPSTNIALDRAQWPNAAAEGIEFVDVLPYSQRLLWWNRLRRVVPGFEAIVAPPSYPLGGPLGDLLARVDAVLMTGGDIISLDYEIFSLSHWAGLVDACIAAGKPAHLLAASIGPFSKDARVEGRMRGHVSGYASVTVRETPSLDYAHKLGRDDAVLVADPAFTMVPQPWDSAAFVSQGNTLGLNVSPLVRETRGDEQAKQRFDAEIAAFIVRVTGEGGMNVLLAPHVYPLDSSEVYSDHAYLSRLLAGLPADAASKTAILPKPLNTAQIKFAIGQCRYFIGARTHATVASLSQLVPTCSIAYSIKALGINRDLFGDTSHVLPTPEVTADTLWTHIQLLQDKEDAIKSLLAERIPEWKERARAGISLLGAKG